MKKGGGCSFWMTKTGYSIMTSARSVCMSVSKVSGAGLCGVESIILSGGKGSNYLLEHNIIAGMENSSIINCRK